MMIRRLKTIGYRIGQPKGQYQKEGDVNTQGSLDNFI